MKTFSAIWMYVPRNLHRTEQLQISRARTRRPDECGLLLADASYTADLPSKRENAGAFSRSRQWHKYKDCMCCGYVWMWRGAENFNGPGICS